MMETGVDVIGNKRQFCDMVTYGYSFEQGEHW